MYQLSRLRSCYGAGCRVLKYVWLDLILTLSFAFRVHSVCVSCFLIVALCSPSYYRLIFCVEVFSVGVLLGYGVMDFIRYDIPKSRTLLFVTCLLCLI